MMTSAEAIIDRH